jgi:Phage integrase family
LEQNFGTHDLAEGFGIAQGAVIADPVLVDVDVVLVELHRVWCSHPAQLGCSLTDASGNARTVQYHRTPTKSPRHSAAVAWLGSGVHIKAVADLLGHSSIAVTGDVYGHTSDTTVRAAVDVLADRLGLLDS